MQIICAPGKLEIMAPSPQSRGNMYEGGVWQAVVDVPPSLQRVVEFLLRVVELLHHVVDIVQSMQTFYNAL